VIAVASRSRSARVSARKGEPMKLIRFLLISLLALCFVPQAHAQHKVTLSWTAPIPPATITCPSGAPAGTTCVQCPTGTPTGTYCTYAPVSSYNVYRGTATGNETKLVSTGNTSTTYVDSAVSAATLYFYYVTATNACSLANCESPKSNEVTITVPADSSPLPPNAPSSLTVTAQ
jgi:hypothetical protein